MSCSKLITELSGYPHLQGARAQIRVRSPGPPVGCSLGVAPSTHHESALR